MRPAEVRKQIETLTGISLWHVVQSLPLEDYRKKVKDPACCALYSIGSNEGALICKEYPDGWEALVEVEGVRRAWSSRASAGVAQVGQMIQAVLQLTTQPIFEKVYHELTPDIVRRYYQTERGPVRFHTRRQSGNRTEVAIEVVAEGRFLRVWHDLTTGRVDLGLMEELDSIPF